ncbi:MAG: low molecular weight protein-tyrosine-phosphatase [Steroidobacteraceae bacterium]
MKRILFVCLGNICRSPTAEGVARTLARREAPHLQLEFDSAGTADYHIGAPPDARSIRAALTRGYDLTQLRARQLQRDDFRRFDLLLAMDEENLANMLRLAPRGDAHRARLFLDYARDCGLAAVPDPYYGDAAGFEKVIDLAEQGVRGLLRDISAAQR